MNPKNLFIDLDPKENPDFGFARSVRSILRNSHSEFSQSAASVALGEYTIPNRDYPYEGFCAILGKENWKLLDGVAFRIKNGGVTLLAIPKNVRIFPWKALYTYSLTGGFKEELSGALLEVEYYLYRSSKLPMLEITYSVSGIHGKGLSIDLLALFDIRHMYAPSDPSGYKISEIHQGLAVERKGKGMVLHSKNFTSFSQAPNHQHWFYKLGSGSRHIAQGQLKFQGEERTLFIPGTISLLMPKGCAAISFYPSSNKKNSPSKELKAHDEKKIIAKVSRLEKTFLRPLRKKSALSQSAHRDILGRLYGLLEAFEFANGDVVAPDAGAFWFRNIWFRDALLGIYENFDIFHKMKRLQVRNFLLAAISMQREGIIPNKLAEKGGENTDYSSADATLLCLLCGVSYLRHSDDKVFSRKFREFARSFLQSLSKGSLRLENYLLACPANYSWIDSRKHAEHFGRGILLPCRLPERWIEKHLRESQNFEEFKGWALGPNYYLVEINALWIRFLRDFNSLYPSQEFSAMEAAASLNFKSFFFSDKACDMVDLSFEKSDLQCSASIYSAALVPELFSDGEISKLISKFETSLVYRKRLLFGILVRNSKNRIFLGDEQYHEAVIWPRESPALFRLLTRIKDSRAPEILESNLKHQMEEGAMFYSHELFALPEGENYAPNADLLSPVPVRNPAQFWSQWVWPYLEFYDEK
ncbi:MAG: amylo-alpha-1,6-glucosidase [Candidatus Micrarchaeota archaeon]